MKAYTYKKPSDSDKTKEALKGSLFSKTHSVQISACSNVWTKWIWLFQGCHCVVGVDCVGWECVGGVWDVCVWGLGSAVVVCVGEFSDMLMRFVLRSMGLKMWVLG